MDVKNILFIQRLPHKAGAQSCLARLLRKLQEQALEPILLISEEGWLTRECQRFGIRMLRTRFPSSRSLSGFLYKNRSFAREVKNYLRQLGVSPPIVHGNDHPEALRTLELAVILNAKSSLMLRTPTMNRSDYFKYRCNQADLIMVESDYLKEAVGVWDPQKRVRVVNNGLGDEEFVAPKRLASSLNKILVLGNPSPRKGWQDVVQAIGVLEDSNHLPPMTFDFTGHQPADVTIRHGSAKLSINFIGHHDDFQGLARQYDLVINASREETFGMAPLEVIAAGVPLLSSRTGVIERVIRNPRLLFEPENPANLAQTFAELVRNWASMDIDLGTQQEEIRRRFHIDATVNRLLTEYEESFR